MEPEKEEEPSVSFCRQRLLRKDDRRFKKYIESTTTHGLVHIFVGKSRIRRVFWLVIMLGAAIGCFYNISDRIAYLASQPTATTISLKQEGSLDFPAVTICNLNLAQRSHLEAQNSIFADLYGFLLTDIDPNDPSFIDTCQEVTDNFINQSLEYEYYYNYFGYGVGSAYYPGYYYDHASVDFRDILYQGRQKATDFIIDCRYRGMKCDPQRDFHPTLTRLGYCYTFNSGRKVNGTIGIIKPVSGTGSRHGLQLFLNIDQYEYAASKLFDAGIRVAIHPQSEPPEPEGFGLAVPPGHNAFMAVRERRVEDKSTYSNCIKSDHDHDFNFVGSEYGYSIQACLVDCLYTNIAEQCGCVENHQEYAPDTSRYAEYPNCGLDDICCVIKEYSIAESCNCSSACNYRIYETGTSYSRVPAEYLVHILADEYNFSDADLPALQKFYQQNILAVNVYFESLYIELQVTEDAYGVVALLSDIGGQLGLFLGTSVISIMEFVVWVLDEVKDRTCDVNERKIAHLLTKKKQRFDNTAPSFDTGIEISTLPSSKALQE